VYVSHLECPKCNAHYESEKLIQLCQCGSPLLVRYDLKKVREKFRKEAVTLKKADLWRYGELLPIKKKENVVSLGEGITPLLPLKNLGHEL